MAAVIIRNLPEEVHRALKIRASHNKRSVEEEIHAILDAVVKPEPRLRLGSALNLIGQKTSLANADIDALGAPLNHNPAEPLRSH